MLPSRIVLNTLRSLGGRGTPPQVRRVANQPQPRYCEGDEVVIALEAMRQRGEVVLTFDAKGNGFYRLPAIAAKAA